MKSSYLYQMVNVAAGLALLALLLKFFTKSSFLEWSLFTTLGGLTIQLENSLSTVCSRNLVRRRHGAKDDNYWAAIAQCKRWYFRFATAIFLLLLIGGVAYFGRAQTAGFEGTWVLEWVIFCLSYFVNYLLAYNSCILIASERISTYSRINIASRLLNVALSCVLVLFGFRVLGLCISLLISLTIGGLSMRAAASALTLQAPDLGLLATRKKHEDGLDLSHVTKIFAFIFASYGLYRVGLLIDAGAKFDAELQANYGLALQILTLVVTLSSVPINMLIVPLQRAVLDGDRAHIALEMGRLAVYANLVFVFAVAGLMAIRLVLPHSSGGHTTLPGGPEFLSLSFGFLIELNILLLVNVAVAMRFYRFLLFYLLSAAIGLTIAVVFRIEGANPYVAFGLIPAVAQLAIAYPLIFRSISKKTGVTGGLYARAAAGYFARIARHPITVGLAFKP
jgi:hypothetical protein